MDSGQGPPDLHGHTPDPLFHPYTFPPPNGLRALASSGPLGLGCASFQQLMRHAISGGLCSTYTEQSLINLAPNPANVNGCGIQAPIVNSQPLAEVELCDEGYSAGTESDIETHSTQFDVDHTDSANPDAECVDTYSDPIDKDEFMAGRDFDYGAFGTVLDDLDFDNVDHTSEVESDTPGTTPNVFHCGNTVPQAVEFGSVRSPLPPNHTSSNLGDIVLEPNQFVGESSSSIGHGHEISQVYKDGISAGYFKRHRAGKQPLVTPTNDRQMGPLDVALSTAEQRIGRPIFEPVLGMVFDSYEEAYEFYNLYSWETGFGIIYNHNSSRPNDRSYRTMQEFSCQKGGIDNRCVKGTKKQNCKARLKLLRSDDERWYVRDFVAQHNHPLSVSCCEKREWGSHKRLDAYTLKVIRELRQINLDQTRVRCVVGGMFGGLKQAPITKRSIRTVCNKFSRNEIDDDVARTVLLFEQMKKDDRDFRWTVQLGPDGTIHSLMWCTGKNKQEYACFGDVVSFDTTYCTNFYKMPFGLFVGVNNHFQTVIFAGVLVRYETTESFKWVFEEFIKLMESPPPETIFTDQSKAMTNALAEIWPDTFHFWCKWHVFKNIRENLGPTYTKNLEFRFQFYSIVNEMLTEAEFEEAWKHLCRQYNLTENPFMIRAFQCRSKWAKAWAHGKFCAGMTSTQRSESANMMLKKFVPRNSSFHHFVSQYNMLLQDREMEEGRQEDQTKQLLMIHSRMWPIEHHAKMIYTKATFLLFRKQVDNAASWVVSGKGSNFYVVSHHKPAERPSWYKKYYKVFVLDGGARYSCECGFFEHIGLLCCHTLRLMIRLDIEKIPDYHILTRWTRDAKSILPVQSQTPQPVRPSSEPLIIWQTQLNAKALEVVTKGNTNRETITAVMKHLKAASNEVDQILLASSQIKLNTSPEAKAGDSSTDVDGNRYGASGSSACLSDSDIEGMKAPPVVRARGCSRFRRYRSGAEAGSKKCARKASKKQAFSFEQQPIENSNDLIRTKPQPPSSRKRKTSSGLPPQSSFCSNCKKSGHNTNSCSGHNIKSSQNLRKVPMQLCTKCGLEGHNQLECLVVASDDENFFK